MSSTLPHPPNSAVPPPPFPAWASLVPDPVPSSTHPPSASIVTLPGHTHVRRADLTRHIAHALDVSRLNRIHPLLWFAGRPAYIRPLHRQRQIQRTILVTEQADLHLVWMNDVIYVQPLPAWLVHHGFFCTHVSASASAGAARGFLASYANLIRTHSDFRIATWARWSLFAAALESGAQNAAVSPRWVYGELRLFRLNMIYRFWLGHLIGGYHLYHTKLSSFFRRNFTWPLVAFAYCTTVLNALQVLLAAERGGGKWDRAAYGIGVGVVVAILASLVAVFWFFMVLLVYNLAKALWRRREVRRRERGGVGVKAV